MNASSTLVSVELDRPTPVDGVRVGVEILIARIDEALTTGRSVATIPPPFP